jgi:hypothetical protein
MGVGLQQWRQAQDGWRLAAWQLPLIETAVGCSLPPLQKVNQCFCFFSFLFSVGYT